MLKRANKLSILIILLLNSASCAFLYSKSTKLNTNGEDIHYGGLNKMSIDIDYCYGGCNEERICIGSEEGTNNLILTVEKIRKNNIIFSLYHLGPLENGMSYNIGSIEINAQDCLAISIEEGRQIAADKNDEISKLWYYDNQLSDLIELVPKNYIRISEGYYEARAN
jgi:hypothetical protein